VGSGNIGATNVGRAVGKFWAIFVLLLDALKGAGPTWAAPWVSTQLGLSLEPQTAQVVAGTCAILGHMFPVWLGFHSGKGVATTLGVISVLAPFGTVAAAVIFVLVFAASRIVSLSSLSAALAFGAFQIWSLLPVPLAAEHRAVALFSIAVPALIIVRHAGNIARLLRGKEAAYKTSSGGKSGSEAEANSRDLSA